MSTERERDYLLAELAELARLIADCDPEEDLTRLGFEARRAEVESELRKLTMLHGRIARASLVFRGMPVLGMRGIEASFGGQALESFQKLIAKASAARGGQSLGTRGPTRNEQSSRLFVTGTLQGSFGFTLEEAAETPLVAATPLAETLDETGQLLLAVQDDEQFADVASQTDPEVIQALSKFLNVIAEHGATLRIRAGEVDVGLESEEMLRAAVVRTESERDEVDTSIEGELQGLLPNGRRFELKRTDTGELVTGRLSKELREPDSVKPFMFKRCVAHLRVITFQRPGKEQRRYELVSITPPR